MSYVNVVKYRFDCCFFYKPKCFIARELVYHHKALCLWRGNAISTT